MNNAARKRPVSSCLAVKATVKAAVATLLSNECVIQSGSVKEGHLIVTDNGDKVYQALEKGKGQPWIVSCYNSERIQWAPPESPLPKRMKCGCLMSRDLSEDAFGHKATKAADWTYCPEHGDGRLDVDLPGE